MSSSRITRLVTALMVGALGVGVISGASATPIVDDPSSSRLQPRGDAPMRGSSRAAVTVVSLDVPWEPGDSVAASAKAPEVKPEVADTPTINEAASRSAGLGTCSTGGSWPDQVRSMITELFGISNIGGYRAGDPGDHGSGLALDVMVPDNPGLGDSVAQWALQNMTALNVSYVIWQQQINMGGGWSWMEDRGSITQNHYDHVHISLYPGGGSCG